MFLFECAGFTLALLGLEAVRGRPLDKGTEATIADVGSTLLILAAIFLVGRDLGRVALWLLGPDQSM